MFLSTKKYLLAFVLLLVLSACGGGGIAPTTPLPSSEDSTLSALVISAEDTTPVFGSGTLAYTLTTSSASTTVTPTVNQTNAMVTVNGTAVVSGEASESIPLAVGNTIISVVVTAQDGSTTQTYTVTISRVTSRALLDPTPGANNNFGSAVVQLANGNIVVSDPFDSSAAINNGAVHLYSPFSSTPIASIYGDVASDFLGDDGITVLGNNNYVISSNLDDEGGIVNAGSVRLMNGATGAAIGAAIVGAVAEDMDSVLVVKPINGDYYILSQPRADSGGQVDAGMVRIVSP